MLKRTPLSTFVKALALAVTTAFVAGKADAMPYASCVTNNNGTIQFYLNESGGNVTVTFNDSTVSPNFNGVTTGTNLPTGLQSFPLTTHTSYTISVAKVGTGAAAVIATKVNATPRGIDVNKNPVSPFFGNVYTANASVAAPTSALWRLNSDFSGISTNSGGVAWLNSASEPYRLAINEDDYVTVGSFASAHSGVWRIDPTISNNQLLLGPTSQAAGYAAQSQGDQFSRPLLIGNLQAGGTATLFTVDAGTIPGVNAAQLNSVLVYSNLTLLTLPHTNAPDLLGPEVCLNSSIQNNYPGITVGPASQSPRYLYCSNRRDGPTGGGAATVQIYDLNNLVANTAGGPTNAGSGPGVSLSNPVSKGCVWSSWLAGTADLFNQDSAGPADSAVSPDGKYFATINYLDNAIKVVSLTNGIPDASTYYRIPNTISATSAGRGLCWDAADNIYLSSSGGASFQEWSLGFTATATTTGTASGTTGFVLTLPNTQVSVYATNSVQTTLFSQSNVTGNPTNATFVITRTGNVSAPVTIPFTLTGTAPGSSYTASRTTNVTMAAGQSSTNITITAINDNIARPNTTVILTLATSGSYSLGLANATLVYVNTATPKLVITTMVTNMYNAFASDYVSFLITRYGDTNAAAITASTFTYGGTAVPGTDFTPATSITFNPGDITYTNYMYPLSNGQPPVHSTATPYVGNKTITVVLGGANGATNVVLMNILDSRNPTTTVLFSDPLTDPADAANWGFTGADNNMQTNSVDTSFITFGYDLQNGDPGDFGAIPLPPSGATTALRLSANKAGGAVAAGINLYATNVTFSGNYAVRFSMKIVQGLNSSVSTEGPLFGINHTGNNTNWFSASTILSGWGAAPGTNQWTADGIWYWVNADTDYTGGSYIEFTGHGGTNYNTGWTQPQTFFAPTFANAFKTNVFSGGAVWAPGLVSSGSYLTGGPTDTNWSDVEMKQLNNIVTMSIDKTPIFVYTNATVWTNGTIMLGYNDPFSSQGAVDAAAYFSNLRVVALAAPLVSQIAPSGSTFVINFTTVDGDAIASSFAVQSSTNVSGPYTDISGVTITPLSAGAFQAVVPQNGAIRFYRIRQK